MPGHEHHIAMTHQQFVDQPEAWAQQTNLLSHGFEQYRTALDALPAEQHRPLVTKPSFHRRLTVFTLFDGWGTVAQTHLGYMLTNEVNSFGQGLQKLAAWACVLKTADTEVKHELLVEFVMPLATHALNLPFALKNRFAFAAMRLSDEANRISKNETCKLKKTSDDSKAPNTWNEFWNYGAPWSSCASVRGAVEEIFPDLKSRLRPIDTHRDRYVHRIPQYLGLGVLETASVEWDHNKWTVKRTELPALDLDEIVAVLTPYHQASLQAHAALCALANEQLQCIQVLLNQPGSSS